jgi:hypothetical protein
VEPFLPPAEALRRREEENIRWFDGATYESGSSHSTNRPRRPLICCIGDCAKCLLDASSANVKSLSTGPLPPQEESPLLEQSPGVGETHNLHPPVRAIPSRLDQCVSLKSGDSPGRNALIDLSVLGQILNREILVRMKEEMTCDPACTRGKRIRLPRVLRRPRSAIPPRS